MNISKHTYLVPSDQQSEVDTWLSALLAPLHRVGMYLTMRRKRARELRELHRFNDRELWDIGLSRSDLLAIEQGVYRRG